VKGNRTRHELRFKANVALPRWTPSAGITVPELARHFGVRPVQIYKRKRQLLENVALGFGFPTNAAAKGSARRGELLKKAWRADGERDLFFARGLRRLS